jgi:hypothetical protein
MAAGFLRKSVRTGGPQAGPSGMRRFARWGSIKRAATTACAAMPDTLAIGRSNSVGAPEAFAKSHRSGNPVRQITFVPVVATNDLLIAFGLCGLCQSWRAGRAIVRWYIARTSEITSGKNGIGGTIRTFCQIREASGKTYSPQTLGA